MPQPGDPQNFNRYAYVRNSPSCLVDPSGHCAGDPNDPDNPDAACWKTYFELRARLGVLFQSPDLHTWTVTQLLDLLTWVNFGIRFEGVWNSRDLGMAIGGLNAMLNALGGISTGYRPCWGSPLLGLYVMGEWGKSVGGAMHKGSNRVDLEPGFTMEVFLHETGHIIDYNLGGGRFWSEQGFQSLGWQRTRFLGFLWPTGWTYSGEVPPHTRADPIEDFADAFALWVMISNGMTLPTGWNPYAETHIRVLTAALFGTGP